MNYREKIYEKNLFTYNLIDITILIFIIYDSFYSLGNVLSIMNFNISSTIRFVPGVIKYHIYEMILIMAKTLLPGFLVASAFLEINKKYNYSNIDSLLLINAISQVMNIKFFLSVKDHGSWQDIGLGISFLVISNIIPFIQIFIFGIMKCLFCKDLKSEKYEALKQENYETISSNSNPNIEIELGLKKTDYQEQDNELFNK